MILRPNSFIQVLSVFLFNAFCCVGLSHANGVGNHIVTYRDWDRDTYAFATVILMVFALTVFVEYVVIDRLLGRPPKARGQLALWVLLINMMTNPALQWFNYFYVHRWAAIADAIAYLLPRDGEKTRFFLIAAERAYNTPFAMLLAGEAIVVAVEFVFFRRVFSHLHRYGRLEHPVSSWRTLLIVVVANLASYFFVFITDLMVDILITDFIRVLLPA